MSLTINGATNTLTAASGLAIAGNTAVTGTLSASGTITSTADPTTAVGIKAVGRSGGNDDWQLAMYRGDGTTLTGIFNSYAGGFQWYGPSLTKVLEATDTGLAVTGTLSATGIVSTTAGGMTIIPTTTTSNAWTVFKNAGGANNSYVGLDASAPGLAVAYSFNVWNGSNTPIIFGVNNAEAMRLTPTALTLGTGVNLAVGNGGATAKFTNYGSASVNGSAGGTLSLEVNSEPRLMLTSDATASYISSFDDNDILFCVSSGNFAGNTGTTRATLSETALTLGSGVNLVMASGQGIDFSATANGSGTTTSEVLSDYEEGTWTPVVSGDGTAGAATYVTQVGKYVKVGRMVTAEMYVQISAHTGTGNIVIFGLPFASGADSYSSVSVGFDNNYALTAGNIMRAYVAPTESAITVRQIPTGGGAASAVPLDSAFQLMMSVSYQV